MTLSCLPSGLVAGRPVPTAHLPLVPPLGSGVEGEYEWMVASESGALSALGYETIADVPAGHALVLRRHSAEPPTLHDCVPATVSPRPHIAPCLFEYVYFARPDSVLDGISVYRTRLRMGDKLARKIMTNWPDYDIDVVIPVPDTSRTSALECAATLGIKYREGFIKNRYIGRTFIMPQQGLRRKSVRQKLAPISSEFFGRNVLLVDDSIVRGTTSKEIILMAREAGAKRVYMASAAPPVRYPNVYGIDMPTRAELVANGQDSDGADCSSEAQLELDVAKAINADRVRGAEGAFACALRLPPPPPPPPLPARHPRRRSPPPDPSLLCLPSPPSPSPPAPEPAPPGVNRFPPPPFRPWSSHLEPWPTLAPFPP